MTPIWVSLRQITLHVLAGSPENMKSNISGMPTVVWTLRHAPLLDIFRTAQGTGCVPRRIFPDFSIRLRAGGRRLSTRAPYSTLCQEPVGDEALDCRYEPHRRPFVAVAKVRRRLISKPQSLSAFLPGAACDAVRPLFFAIPPGQIRRDQKLR
jgi:hypothetical protein